MTGYVGPIEKQTLDNNFFRKAKLRHNTESARAFLSEIPFPDNTEIAILNVISAGVEGLTVKEQAFSN